MRAILSIESLSPGPAGVGGVAAGGRDNEARALLVVTNRTHRWLWSFNVMGHESGSWGHELLEGAVLPGDSAAWEVTPGVYHLRAETADGTRVQIFGLSVAAGQLARWVVEDERGP